jgi:hypothetical protein
MSQITHPAGAPQTRTDDDLLGHCPMSGMGIIAASVVIAASHVEDTAPNANFGRSRQVIVAATAATPS